MQEPKHILVTGAAGSIGSELVRQLVNDNDVYCLDNNETALFDLLEELRLEGKNIKGRFGDIRELETLREVFNDFLPDTIFHCAALKHVTPNEWNPEEAVKTNVLGTINLLKVAKEKGVHHVIFISTDKAVNSDSVMGVSKRLCELIVKNAGGVSVRFANVLGSRGSVVPIWQKQIDEGRPVTITDPRMERYFMSIPDAAELVIKATEIGTPGDLIVLDMNKPVNVLEALKMTLKNMNKENYPIQEIGIRPGESLTERLMTEQEEKVAKKVDKFYVIHGRNI